MHSNKLRMLTRGALMSAFTCVATLLIRIPTPTKGYVNLGDCLVNISAWMLGPFYGAAAAGIGSSLADITTGYIVYAPATFIIKASMAVVSFLLASALTKRMKITAAARIISASIAELMMTMGYFLYESFIYGSPAAAFPGVAANLIQGAAGAAGSVLIYEAVIKKFPKKV